MVADSWGETKIIYELKISVLERNDASYSYAPLNIFFKK